MPLGERRHELRLGTIGVLELVDEDVPEAPGDRFPGGRRCPDEAQRERTWSPKSMQPFAASKRWYVA
jgi:hypothetical protein